MDKLSVIWKIMIFSLLIVINSNLIVLAQYERDDLEETKKTSAKEQFKLSKEQQKEKLYSLFTKVIGTQKPEDQYRLGKMFQHGSGVEKDDIQAYVWTALALTNGYPGATKTLRDLESTMSTYEINYAIDLLRKIRELR